MTTEKCAGILADCAAFWRGDQTGPRLSVVAEPSYRQDFDAERPGDNPPVAAAVACMHTDMAAADRLVLPTVYADYGTISTAKLYGGKVIPPPENGKVHIEPVVRQVAELAGLRPAAFEASDFQSAVDFYRLACEQLGNDQVFLRTPDFQGPMNTLALVMDQQELLIGMLTAPAAIHAALDSITTTLIDYHLRLRRELGGGKVIGNIWPYTILPEHLGASLTQDMMPLLGPELYRDFELPCLRRIAEAFGGVMIHCCGKYTQHLPALRDSGIAIRGLEFHHPFTPFATVHDIFGDDIVYVPYLFGECRDYSDFAAFAADLLRQGTSATRFWFALAEGWCDTAAMRQLIAQ